MSSQKSPALLDEIRRIMHLGHYSLHTERTYCDWIKQFVKFKMPGVTRRHHIDQSLINKAIRAEIREVGINKRVTAHTFRHGFATHLLQRGTDIRAFQVLLGQSDSETTMIYTHVLHQGGQSVLSPLDDL